MPEEELMAFAKDRRLRVGARGAPGPHAGELICGWRRGHPADAAMMMQLGVDGVFVGSGIFKSGERLRRGAIVRLLRTTLTLTSWPRSAETWAAQWSRNASTMPDVERIAGRGW
jgi:pyridoxal 5'-phosphate synthase pdxS subunit